MRIVIAGRGREAEDVELRIADEEATVSDLRSAAGFAERGGILIDGRFCRGDSALREIGLYEGAVVHPAASAEGAITDPLSSAAALELRVISGLNAGVRVPLIPEGLEVGRDDDCDVVLDDARLSRRHLKVAPSAAGLRATVTDLGSGNGTWLEGRRLRAPAEIGPGDIFEAGDCAFTLAERGLAVPVDPSRHAGRAGTIPFNRPPRPRAPEPPGPLAVPEAPPKADKPRLSMVSAVGPLVLGLVMVLVMRNVIFALFMLLSPFLVIGTWVENRRVAGRTAAGNTKAHQQELEKFEQELKATWESERVNRRQALPDPAELLRRAAAPDRRLWERRPAHADFMRLCAGLGEDRFRPEVQSRYAPAPRAEELLAAHERQPLAPAHVDLGEGGAVGIVGPRSAALAVARSLVCQAAVLHGPADLQIALLCESSHRADWEWAKWLPHTRDLAAGGSRRLAAEGAERSAILASGLSEAAGRDSRRTLAVLDGRTLIEGRGAVGRALLRAPDRFSGLVIAETPEQLPAATTTVIELAAGTAEAILTRPQLGERVDPLLAAGLSLASARGCALSLARFEDPDLELEGGALPDAVSLLPLIGLTDPSPETLLHRWRSGVRRRGLPATFALAEDGPLNIDFVADGPHGLIAGTTGAGKSELLRSLVAALAADHGPEALNFVLIDYKGGSAFAQCAQLRHTVGMVTDLDEQLGERALQSLEAELRYRETVLRDHGVGDLIEYSSQVAAGRAKPLPRLLVIIDEFATLAAELPDFVPSLVGIAQRGRSLGVHMLLATQRPSGAVNENIRANTNLRICLRVQTGQDSQDVIDSPLAARIGRSQPGRAQVRLGPGELVAVQAALVTGYSDRTGTGAVEIAPFSLIPPPEGEGIAVRSDMPTDLERLVAAAAGAAETYGYEPRRPWLPPLAGRIELDELLTEPAGLRTLAGSAGLTVPIGMADDPKAQTQYPIGWNLDAGNLVMYGIGGSGTTTALKTIATSLSELAGPDAAFIYVLDFGAGELSVLGDLPHVGAVIGASEHERQRRLISRLRAELGRRRQLDGAERAAQPRIVVLLDGFSAFQSEHSDLAGDAVRDELARVFSDGTEVGIHVVIAADRTGAVPVALASLAQQRLAFQLADLADYAQFGIQRRSVPTFVPGRAVVAGSGQVVQIAVPAGRLDRALQRARRDGATARRAAGVEVLPARFSLDRLPEEASAPDGAWAIRFALGDQALAPVGFDLYEAEHALIAGPARSGRTNALLTIAQQVARTSPDTAVYAIAGRRSALREHPGLVSVVEPTGDLAALVTELGATQVRRLLLVDDADAVDDPGRSLSNLLSAGEGNLHVIAAGRADGLRSAMGHWTGLVRRSRTGLLLMPDLQVDGALFGVVLPRRPEPPSRPGCGFLVRAGTLELAQVAEALSASAAS